MIRVMNTSLYSIRQIFKLRVPLFILVAAYLSSSFAPRSGPAFGIRTVVIDPGHGGKDPGCHGSRYKEKDVALAVSLKLGEYIEEYMKDVKVVYTRKTDVFVELQERANIANKAKADLFICIHCNSACVRDKKTRKDICKEEVHGAETYVMGLKNEQGKLDVAKRENSAILLEDNYVQKYDGFDPNSDESYIIMSMFTDKYVDQSLNFASKLQNQYRTKAGRHDKGVKRASLWVLWRTYMPSVLTEIGYLTNPDEERFLGSKKGQEYIAAGIFRAFREYKDELEGGPRKYDDRMEKQPAYQRTAADSAEETAVVTPVVQVREDTADGKVIDQNGQVTEEVKETVAAPEEKVIYKVQIASSSTRLLLTDSRFKGVEKPGEYLDKGIYKYTAGEFTEVAKATELQSKLRKNGFKDAFVIATRDGRRIPLK